jgi:hypothetical protein
LHLSGPKEEELEEFSEEEYEYSIKPAALETLINLLLNSGIDLRAQHYSTLMENIVFRSEKLLNLRKLKLDRIVREYTITKIISYRQIVEKG